MELSALPGSEGSFATGLYEAGLMAMEKLGHCIISILSCLAIHTRQVQEVDWKQLREGNGSITAKSKPPFRPQKGDLA